jgi:hypothetical protein
MQPLCVLLATLGGGTWATNVYKYIVLGFWDTLCAAFLATPIQHYTRAMMALNAKACP